MTIDTGLPHEQRATARHSASSAVSRSSGLHGPPGLQNLASPGNWPVWLRLVGFAFVPTAAALSLIGLRVSRDWGGLASAERVVQVAIPIVALALGAVALIVVARSITRPLETLRASALDVAENRLPAVVRRLEDSGGTGVDVTVEPTRVQSRDEVGQVARAFDEVYREAVRLASEQATLRANVDAVFANLSRRSQSLVERQLGLIDDLETGEQDADQLAHLFKLDHLATRMRRHAENLLVLAGERSERRWGEPMSLLGVARAAMSEVEEYERIEVGHIPDAEVSSPAVKDTVHLLAELLENATAYSSRQSAVALIGESLGDGRAMVEVVDSGIGMSAGELTAANERLATKPEMDVSASRHMGLFVVGRLAWRHGIRVQLRTAQGGGVSALVMLPAELVTLRGGDRAGDTAGAAAAPGRAARPAAPGREPARSERPGPGQPRAAGAANGRPAAPAETPAVPPGLPGAAAGPWEEARQRGDALAEPSFGDSGERERLPVFDATWSEWVSQTWRTAEETVASPASGGVTVAGLPRRVPGRNFVPGSAGAARTSSGAHAASREPDAVGGRLADYHRGLQRGRHARPETSTGGESPAGHDEREQEDA